MGNDQCKGENRLAIAAMSHATKFNNAELSAMHEEFFRLANETPEHPDQITRAQMVKALDSQNEFSAMRLRSAKNEILVYPEVMTAPHCTTLHH